MNAYELLEKITGLNSCEPVIIKACEDVIRQQAKRIEELESHKELSNEEIQAIADETDVLHALNKDWIFIFARAIIKASRGEK